MINCSRPATITVGDTFARSFDSSQAVADRELDHIRH